MMIRVVKVSILGLLAQWALPLQAQQGAPLDCLIEPNRVIDVSSAVRGVLSSVGQGHAQQTLVHVLGRAVARPVCAVDHPARSNGHEGGT